MKLIIHRGTHQIGGSCVEIRSGNTRIIVDIGIPLVDKTGKEFDLTQYRKKLGHELLEQKILPDVKGLYEWDKDTNRVNAVFISHSHIDHYGFAKYIHNDIPVYVSKPSFELIAILNKFNPHNSTGIKNKAFYDNREKILIDDIMVTPFLVDHSAFSAYGFLIQSGGKNIFYTGDFRVTGRKEKMMKDYGKQLPKIDSVLCDGTVFSSGRQLYYKNPTEQEIEDALIEKIRNIKQRLIFATFSPQNVDRLVSFIRASIGTKTIFIIDLYTAAVMDKVSEYCNIGSAKEHASGKKPFLRIWCPGSQNNLIKDYGYNYSMLTDLDFIKYYLRKTEKYNSKIILMFRGKAENEYERDIPAEYLDNSAIFYSKWKGYYEKENRFFEKHDMQPIHVHTSGHASKEDLVNFMGNFNYKNIVPIHTTAPQLFRKHFGDKVLDVQDGEIIEI